MATTFFLYLVLLLLAEITHSSPPQPTTYLVQADHLVKLPHFTNLEQWYHSMVAAHSPRAANTSGRILYTYETVMHGFAVRLTGDEARSMSNAPGVTGVYEDRLLHLLTTRSPGFLGLDPGFGAWKDTDFGNGVIIGFVDTGIWPESASFNDRGLGPVRSSWRGMCVNAEDFHASLCNNKLVGAKAFAAAARAIAGSNGGNAARVPSPRDTDGHGTHVASTAAGSEVHDVGIAMFAQGTARGVAPKARIAMYAVDGDTYTPTADVVAAIDAAVSDGVDIISISLGYDLAPFYNDTLSIATFEAERRGVVVVLAGGNSGPEASSVVNVAPWMTTVGATTVDRLFPASLNLGDGVVLTGQSLYPKKINGTTMVPLVSMSCIKDHPTPEMIKGKILVCSDGAASEDEVRNAGGIGQIITSRGIWYAEGTEAIVLDIPTVLLGRTAGEQLRSYMSSSAYPVASFTFTCETVIGENRAPLMVSFSSRGPNPVVPELLKPDLVAPGQNILAAWLGSYDTASGTSMACPHVAGVAVLIKKKHSGWTPAMIRSAMITTAATLDNTGREILDNAVTDVSRGATAATPFDFGAGHVRPQLAMDPGLVYDAGARDYIDFLCALNYTTEQLSRFAPDLATSCTRTTLPGGPADLNYPSFVVIFDGRTDVRKLTRTVTKVYEEAETYKVTVAAPEQVKVTVTPTTLEFNKHMETRSYTVEFRNEAGENLKVGWEFGHIIWETKDHRVRSPVAFQWKN